MTAPTSTAAGTFDPMSMPCPDWCTQDRIPDPGVVDHYSREWTGSDYLEGAQWRIQIVQTVNADGPDLPYIDVMAGEGAFRSVAEFARALMQAEALRTRILDERARLLGRV